MQPLLLSLLRVFSRRVAHSPWIVCSDERVKMEFYILDTETSGLKIDFHEINQISIMRVKDKAQITFQIKVKHPECYSTEALQVQGISPDDLKIGIPIEEAVEKLNVFFAEDGKTKAHRCIIAHNAPFDRKFVHRAWDTVDSEFPADLWMCTLSFGKRYVKKHGGDKLAKAQLDSGIDIKLDKFGNLKPKFGLNNMLAGLGIIAKDGSHRAEIDVQNTLELYNWLMSSKTEHVSLIERIPHKDVPVQQIDMDDVE